MYTILTPIQRELLEATLSEQGFIEIGDDHNSGTEMHKIKHFAVLASKEICPCFEDSAYFCLNPVYFHEETKTFRLQTASSGGVVNIKANGGLVQGVVRYNVESVTNALWEISSRKIVTRLIGERIELNDSQRRTAAVAGLNNVCFGDGVKVAGVTV